MKVFFKKFPCRWKAALVGLAIIGVALILVSAMSKLFSDESVQSYPARALIALGLLLADGAPTVGGGKPF